MSEIGSETGTEIGSETGTETGSERGRIGMLAVESASVEVDFGFLESENCLNIKFSVSGCVSGVILGFCDVELMADFNEFSDFKSDFFKTDFSKTDFFKTDFLSSNCLSSDFLRSSELFFLDFFIFDFLGLSFS